MHTGFFSRFSVDMEYSLSFYTLLLQVSLGALLLLVFSWPLTLSLSINARAHLVHCCCCAVTQSRPTPVPRSSQLLCVVALAISGAVPTQRRRMFDAPRHLHAWTFAAAHVWEHSSGLSCRLATLIVPGTVPARSCRTFATHCCLRLVSRLRPLCLWSHPCRWSSSSPWPPQPS